MNSLHRRLQFFSTGGGKLKVVLPEEFSTILTDTQFYTEVKCPIKEGVVSIYLGNTLLSELTIENKIASGYIVIPNSLIGIGSTYIIQYGQEIPIGNTKEIILVYNCESSSKGLYINIEGNRDFLMGDAKGNIGILGEINPFDFGTAYGEISLLGEISPFDFGTANGNITIVQ